VVGVGGEVGREVEMMVSMNWSSLNERVEYRKTKKVRVRSRIRVDTAQIEDMGV